MKKIVVLGGAGAMGQVIVRDLAEFSNYDAIVIADFNKEKAEELKNSLKSKKLEAAFTDLKNPQSLAEILKDAYLVINSTPYYFNVDVMKAALAASCHYIDLGGLFHVTKQQLELNDEFRTKGLAAILGMGAAPGMTNIMAAAGAGELDEVKSIDITVGCIDFVTTDHPLQPPYAIDTILDEYTKEPMVFEDGEYRAKPPMSGEKLVQLPEPVGACKAILTLHSEVLTLPKTFEHKGCTDVTFRLGLPTEFHDRLKLLVDLGLGGNEKIETTEGKFTPRKVLAHLIERFPSSNQTPDDAEVVRVEVKGKRNGQPVNVTLETTVLAHKKWGLSCGALDTGVPPAIVADMLLAGTIMERGTIPPEVCVPHKEFFHELAKRTMVMRKTVEEVLVEAKTAEEKLIAR
ncbi:MAG: saccharopine dehydrogenase NADP-binding domain-containing protein [Candidatus Melainabacteria bacterium]|nr:saccharopine dehydrogenase NADP-binding domain-containing protein [Candidatus Melainabacteria bacterium]